MGDTGVWGRDSLRAPSEASEKCSSSEDSGEWSVAIASRKVYAYAARGLQGLVAPRSFWGCQGERLSLKLVEAWRIALQTV